MASPAMLSVVGSAPHGFEPEPRDAVGPAARRGHEAAAVERLEQIEGAERQQPPLTGEAFDGDNAAGFVLVMANEAALSEHVEHALPVAGHVHGKNP